MPADRKSHCTFRKIAPVGVRVRMRFMTIQFEIVHMAMGVGYRFLGVQVLVVLGQVEPYARAHNTAAIQNVGEAWSPTARIAIAAPMNGAVEKYALVRVEPRSRRVSTNNTRLILYSNNPTTIAALITGTAGTRAPSMRAIPVLTTLATVPLSPVRNRASEADTLQVKLLSSAQHRQAPAIHHAPQPRPLVP